LLIGRCLNFRQQVKVLPFATFRLNRLAYQSNEFLAKLKGLDHEPSVMVDSFTVRAK
jgi:hypothetical protein